MLDYLWYLSLKTEPIFNKIIYMSIIASFIGIVILIIRKISKKQISPIWISRIWLVFIISLIIPIQIKSPISIYNYIPISEDSVTYELEEFIKSEDKLFSKNVNQNSLEVNSETKDIYGNDNINHLENSVNIKNEYTIRQFIPVIWGIIVITTIFAYILTYIAFEFKIRKYKYENDKIEKILDSCKEKLNIKTKIKIVKQDIIKMPALFGIFNKRILLNDNILELSEDELKYVFIHELSHYKRKDNLLNILITILRVIYFFNPIIWISLSEIKNDLELATDELAMKNENKETQKEYSKTLVKLSVINSDKFLIQTICMSDGKKNLERRIDNMKKIEMFKNKKIIIISMIIIVFIILVFCSRSLSYVTQNEIINLLEEAEKIRNVQVDFIHIYNDGSKLITTQFWKDNVCVTKNDENEIILYLNFNTEEAFMIDRDLMEITLDNTNNYEKFSASWKYFFYDSELFRYKYLNEEEINNCIAHKVQLIRNDNNEIRTFWIDVKYGVVLKFELLLKNNREESIYSYKYDVVNENDVEKIDFNQYENYKYIQK